MIKGRTITLIEAIDTGEVDEFNAPIFEHIETTVENVIIQPAVNDDVVSEYELHGKHLEYILHIPKGDNHNWEDAIIILPDPWNKTVRAYGDSMLYDADMTPLKWNRAVKVEKYE